MRTEPADTAANPDPGWNFDPGWARLPGRFFERIRPTPVTQPRLIWWNATLAAELGLDFSGWDEAAIAAVLAGNVLPDGAEPLAQAYAGHQFGHFTMLGDGRAILLGEQVTADGRRFDIQLKGAGRTSFSRGGDGRATLSSMLREALISEAMHALGIASSRSLAVVATGEPVLREEVHAGAVLTRIAASHIRVGSFEYARHMCGEAELAALLDYSIRRHDPELLEAERPALAFLERVMQRQITLVVNWLRVGFIHGVMNTDNMGIAGETFDYGPCAFMNAYDPATVFSSIDRQGRYAYANQAPIAHWNLACLAGALLPLVNPEPERAVEEIRAVLDPFPEQFESAWLDMMRSKLGVADLGAADPAEDRQLVHDLLAWMQARAADWTNTFLALEADPPQELRIRRDAAFEAWEARWLTRLAAEGRDAAMATRQMQRVNPRIIPRNHRVEAALNAAAEGDMAPFETLLDALRHPEAWPGDPALLQPPPDGDRTYRTFCGT